MIKRKMLSLLFCGWAFLCAAQTGQLQDMEIDLMEVVISGRTAGERVGKVEMGVEKLKIQEIKKMPALMGEVDVLKSIQLLPGVQATSEGGSGFSVRGGSPDQNLILIDNATVYNASHMLGFFSVFNHDVVSSVELYKGDLPLKYGGRLSSLLEVQTLESRPDRFQGTGGIGLISSRLMLQGPAGENTSWLVGGRRSYADLFLFLSPEEAVRNSSLYFYDLNVKANHRISAKDRIAVSGYYGRDNFGMGDVGRFNYGNAAASLMWNRTFSEYLYSKFSLNFSDYRYGISSKLEGSEIDWSSAISDWMFRADFTQLVSEQIKLTYGLTSTWHQFSPGLVVRPNNPDYKLESNQAFETTLYLSNEHKVNEKWNLKYGLRWTAFQNIGPTTVFQYDQNYELSDSVRYSSGKIYNTYHAFEPRFGVLYKLDEVSSLKAGYAHNTQFIQLANNSASGSPMDIWFSAGPNVKPQQMDLFSVGYFRNLDNAAYETSVEVYYKASNHLVDFADHAQLILNPQLEGEIRSGKGKAYGAEFMIKKNTGPLTGFLNYTLSRSERTIPEINDGKTYLSPYDKTHSINLFLSYEFSKKWMLSGTWVYATGNPTTYPTGRFVVGTEYFPIYSGRNEYRMPDYHRMDLSLTYVPDARPNKAWKGEWNFSIYNVYNQKNPWVIGFEQKNGGIPYAEKTYLFGIVPSVTYNFKF